MTERRLEQMSREDLIRELEKHAIAARRVATAADELDREGLIHDLHVHQVELEMQNRELRETQERLEEATLRYADLYDFAPVGYCTLAPEGTIREINLTGARLLGMTREQVLEKSFLSVAPLKDRRPFDEHLERCKNNTVRVTSELSFFLGRRGPLAVHIISEPILDASGRATAFRTILIDISELKQLENKLRLLSEAGAALSSSLDYGTTLKTVARLAVPALADRCTLDVVQEEGHKERLAVTFAGKQDAEVERVKESGPGSGWQTAQAGVIASGEPMLLSEVPETGHEKIAQDDPDAQPQRTEGIRSLVVVPLFARGRTFGALTLAATESDRRYSPVDLRLAQDLANRAAMALDNARLYAEAQKAIEDLQAAQDQLHQFNQTLELRVGERTKWLTLMHDVTRGINDAPNWDEALRLVLKCVCESEQWQIGFVYMPDRETPDVIGPIIGYIGDERFRPFLAASVDQRYPRGQTLPGRVYASAAPLWLNDRERLLELLPIRAALARDLGLQAAAALPIRFGRDVSGVLELFSDQPHEPNEVLQNLMNDVSAQMGKVLERERATAQAADLVWREQQELLHTLHDSLGQTLTGLGMLSSGLGRQFSGTNRAASDTARQVAEQAQLALEQVRQLSRGLFPLEIDAEGLMPALRELASTTETFHSVRVQTRGNASGPIRDSRVATELYRIAQEAVTNAVKHARARTIQIEVTTRSGVTEMRVIDDGVGMRKEASKADGLGLRIMRYRAASVGALLSIEPGSSGGTMVTCTLRSAPVSAESEAQP